MGEDSGSGEEKERKFTFVEMYVKAFILLTLNTTNEKYKRISGYGIIFHLFIQRLFNGCLLCARLWADCQRVERARFVFSWELPHRGSEVGEAIENK